MKTIAKGLGLSLALALTALATPGFAFPGGTLPLRLGNGGTLPLSMSGQAQNTAGQAQEVTAQMTLTHVTQDQLPDAQAANLVCQISGARVSKHSAQGSIAVGDGQYAVKGICFDHDSSTMEIVAERLVGGGGAGIERSFMTGGLVAETPHDFSGRLIVSGGSPHAGHYTFAIRCPGLMPRMYDDAQAAGQ